MNCKNCGAPLTPADQFCRNCGATVTAQDTTINNNMGSMPKPAVEPVASSTAFNSTTPNPTSMFSDINNMLNSINSTPTSQPTTQTPVSAPTQAAPIPTIMPQQQATVEPTVNQQPSSAQPTMNNNMGDTYNNAPQNTNKGGSGKYIFMAILAIAVIAAVVLVVMYLGQKDDNTTNNNNQTTATGSSISNVSKVKYGNYTFNVPNDMTYEVGTELVAVYDDTQTWAAQLEFVQVSYAALSNRMSELQSAFSQQGLTVSPAKKETYGGIEMITLEASANGENLLMAIAKIDSNHVLGITLANVSNEFDYNTLSKLAPIVSSVKYGESTNSIAPANGVNFSGLSQFAQQ